MPWSADSLSCVLFLPVPLTAAPDAYQAWQRTFGGGPQSYQQNTPGGIPGNQAMAAMGEYQMMIAAQPGRTELTLLPIKHNPIGAQSAITANPELLAPAIPDWRAALDFLLSHTARFLAGQTAARVALLVNLSEKARSQAEAGVLFRQATRSDVFPPGSSELTLGFNSVAEAAGVGINRLCRWGTGIQNVVVMQGAVGVAPVAQVVELHAAYFTVDVNTMPRPAPFTVQQTIPLFDALAAEAKTIILEGYDHFARPV